MKKRKVCREGKDRRGKRQNFSCGFCKEHFTSQRLRNKHTSRCSK